MSYFKDEHMFIVQTYFPHKSYKLVKDIRVETLVVKEFQFRPNLT